jgi:hypothetical protein
VLEDLLNGERGVGIRWGSTGHTEHNEGFRTLRRWTVPRFAGWLRGQKYLDPATRAQGAWNRINDAPVSLVLIRGGVPQPAQTVRISITDATVDIPQTNSQLGVAGQQTATVFGVRDHLTVANTDIKRGDRFIYGGQEFDVRGIASYPGEVQAYCEVRS